MGSAVCRQWSATDMYRDLEHVDEAGLVERERVGDSELGTFLF